MLCQNKMTGCRPHVRARLHVLSAWILLLQRLPSTECGYQYQLSCLVTTSKIATGSRRLEGQVSFVMFANCLMRPFIDLQMGALDLTSPVMRSHRLWKALNGASTSARLEVSVPYQPTTFPCSLMQLRTAVACPLDCAEKCFGSLKLWLMRKIFAEVRLMSSSASSTCSAEAAKTAEDKELGAGDSLLYSGQGLQAACM